MQSRDCVNSQIARYIDTSAYRFVHLNLSKVKTHAEVSPTQSQLTCFSSISVI